MNLYTSACYVDSYSFQVAEKPEEINHFVCQQQPEPFTVSCQYESI